MHPNGFMSTGMSVIGERLKEERNRLGLTQAQLAEKIGIHRNTQNRYENGEREPDTAYLDALKAVGVDLAYVLSGDTPSEREADNIINAYIVLIEAMAKRLGMPKAAVIAATHQPLENPDIFRNGGVISDEVIDGLFEGSCMEVDSRLLSSILEGVENSLLSLGLSVSASKKAQAVTMLYRAFKARGEVDPAMIREAITLAAS